MKDFIAKLPSLLVGMLFWGGLVLTGYVTIVQTKAFGTESGIHIPVMLETAEGLRAGAPVLVMGVKMGVLSSLHYVQVDENGFPLPWNVKESDLTATGRDRIMRKVPGKDPEKILDRYYGKQAESPGVRNAAAKSPAKKRRAAGQAVLAILDLDKNVPIYPNYKVVTRFQSVVSQKIVELLPGRLDPKRPNWKPRLLSLAELRRFEKTGAMPELGPGNELLRSDNFDDPMYLIASVINENREPIFRITSNLRDISAKMNRGENSVATVINRPDLHGGANQAILALGVLVQEARDGVEDLRESRAGIDFMGGWLITILQAAAGGG